MTAPTYCGGSFTPKGSIISHTLLFFKAKPNIQEIMMRKAVLFRRSEFDIGGISLYLACVFMVALLAGACAGGETKQASLRVPPPPSFSELSASSANETDQASAEGEPENGLDSDDYTEECRYIKLTGSRFKRKICAPIAEWAEYDRKMERETDRFARDVSQSSGVNTDSSNDSMGGQTTGVPR
jgi:hypothetical protein